MAYREFISSLIQGRSWGLLLVLSVSLFAVTACQQEPVQSIQLEQQDLTKHPVYSQYDFGHDEKVINIGVQPLFVPVSVIIETMRRDAIFQEALEALGMSVRFHAFAKGVDINFFLQRGDLDAGVGGDMPALLAAVKDDVLVASMVQQGFLSIMANRPMLLSDMKGKRIAYPTGSNAHYALLNAMHAIGIDESRVEMVALDVAEMPGALKRGEIDLFVAWEPTPAIARHDYGAEPIYRSLSTGYIYFSRQYVGRHPKTVRHLIASQIRSMKWLNRDFSNLVMASGWAKNAWKEFSDSEMPLSKNQIATLAMKDVLQLTSIPIIPEKELIADGRLHREFEFLKERGLIPRESLWDETKLSFSNEIVEAVMGASGQYGVHQFRLRNPATASKDE